MGFFICRIVRVFLLGGGGGWKIFILFMFSVLYISNGNNYVFMLNIMKF